MNQIEEKKILNNRYRIEKLLGEGANGKTWLGLDLVTGAQVAVKSLKLAAAENIKSFDLFKREAAVLASINVVGVPKFYDSYVAQSFEDESYIVQEYVNALSIHDYLKSMRFTVADTLFVLERVVQILHVLQTQYTPAIIHRDIKPSNIMCRAVRVGDKFDFQNAEVYLIDFGAVANPQKSSGGSTVAGTFGYMPPEQYTGSISPQSDFYSLGVTAIHMLTGLEPFEMTANVYELQYRDTLLEIVPDARPELFELLDCMIAPDPKKRPDTAEQLFLAIQRVTKGLSPFPKEEDVGLDANALKKVHDQNDHSAKRLLKRQTERTTGRVRTTRQFKESYVEYTFEANGRTWCGLDKRIRLKLDEAMQMPREMVVRYDKEDPTNNSIVFDW